MTQIAIAEKEWEDAQINNDNTALLPAMIKELETEQTLSFLRNTKEYKHLLGDYITLLKKAEIGAVAKQICGSSLYKENS